MLTIQYLCIIRARHPCWIQDNQIQQKESTKALNITIPCRLLWNIKKYTLTINYFKMDWVIIYYWLICIVFHAWPVESSRFHGKLIRQVIVNLGLYSITCVNSLAHWAETQVVSMYLHWLALENSLMAASPNEFVVFRGEKQKIQRHQTSLRPWLKTVNRLRSLYC